MAKWWTLVMVAVATFMLLLDITVVNVALPDIQRELDASFSDVQWVVDAYALSLAAFLLTAGSLADLLGRRFVFVIGLAIFSVASLLCGLADTPLLLNLARGLQGVGGAVMFATSLALLAAAYNGRDRAVAIGVWGATIGGAVAVGPLVGGVLTESLGWEWIFFVNVPIGIAAIAITLKRVAETRNPQATGIDWPGLLTFSSSLFLLVFALVRGNAEGWSSTLIVSFLAGAAVLMVAFVAVEAGRERAMLDLTLFRKRAFAGASIAAFALSAGMFAMFLYLTLYLQNALGHEPLETGLRFLPLTLASFFVAPVVGRLTEKLPVRIFMGGGLAIVGAGLLLMRGLDADSEWTALLAGFIVAGVGIGMTNPALASTAVGVVPAQRSGMASGINNTFRQVGIATGIAALGAVFEHRIANAWNAICSPSVDGATLAATRPRNEFSCVQGGNDPYAAAFTTALDDILLIGAVVVLVAAVLAFAFVRQSDFVPIPGMEPASSG